MSIAFIAALLILSFWYPLTALVIFLIVFGLFEVIIISGQYEAKYHVVDDEKYTPEEQQVIKKYFAFFKYPFASKGYVNGFTWAKYSSFIWLLIALQKEFWVVAIIIVCNYFLLSYLINRMNPRAFLYNQVKKGKAEYAQEMKLVDSLIEKIFGIELKDKDYEKAVDYCIECGKELSVTSVFCSHCGAKKITT